LTIIEKVSKFLHEEGYFGVVGIDILKNAQGQCYLVDLNPRLTGITPFLIISRLFMADGMTHGIYLPGKTFSMSAASLLKFVETIGNGKIIIQAYYEDMKAAITHAHIAIIANSTDERDLLIHQISDL
jgi:biotin carboxylase